MIKLKPLIHETIWGGHKFDRYIEPCKGIYTKVGHLYLINGHMGMTNIVEEGEWKGRTLYELFAEKRSEWGLNEYEEFPLTVAFVDANESLSIQVHPDDIVAEALEGRRIGKEESWFFLEGPKDGYIYYGCKTDNGNTLREAINNGCMEEITGKKKVTDGEYVCIKAGTLHAMTAGSVAYEVEYGSDITYRFFDYHRIDDNGKERELHIEKAMCSINLETIQEETQANPVHGWVSEDHYEIQVLKNINEISNTGMEIECIADVDRGRGLLLFPGEELHCDMRMAIVARLKR